MTIVTPLDVMCRDGWIGSELKFLIVFGIIFYRKLFFGKVFEFLESF